jgi:hypothetical protein
MTDLAAIAADADAEAQLRWRNWEARGTENDRRRGKTIRALMILLAAAFLLWFALQVV